MTLKTHKYQNNLPGEICHGFFSSQHIDKFVTWDTKRRGNQQKKRSAPGEISSFYPEI